MLNGRIDECRPNLILMTDSYKLTHWKQYPQGTSRVYSYFESRGGDFKNTVFFGLQYFIKKYLEGWVISKESIEEAEEVCNWHIGPNQFNRAGWEHILNKYGGRLPVSIKAVPEGTIVPSRNVLMTIENTDPACFWLTNYLETMLVQVWYPTTVATQSKWMKDQLNRFLEKTGTPESIDFKLHDFGFRGVSSVETAGLGAAAHLINFKGTDTMAGLLMARDFYGAEKAGFSIPASEHSTITSWGREHEVDAMRNMLTQYPTGLVACVSDSFDIFKACSDLWGKQLKQEVLARDGVLVIRPDSGDPLEVLPKILLMLTDQFGCTVNSKGYKVLNDKVRLIQGDGIDKDSMVRILEYLTRLGWSTDNIAFGSGGGLLQKLNRDTCKFAFKCSNIEIDGKDNPVYKQPITDKGKNSKQGRLSLHRTCCGSGWETYDNAMRDLLPLEMAYKPDELVEVFRDGKLLVDQTFDDIRERANPTGLFVHCQETGPAVGDKRLLQVI